MNRRIPMHGLARALSLVGTAVGLLKNHMKRLIRPLCLSFLLASFVVPAGTAATGPAVQDIHLIVETPRYELDAQGLRVPGYALSDRPGAPKLPVWTTVVEVPADMEWAIEHVGGQEQLLSAPAVLPPSPVMTLQLGGPLSNYDPDRIADALTAELRPDPAIYRANTFYPRRIVEAGPEGTANGRRLLPIKVHPFQYNPVTGALRYRPCIELTIHFEPQVISGEADRLMAAPHSPAAAPGLRVKVAARGMHRLTYEALQTAGAPVSGLDPGALAMWHLGKPVAIEVTGSADGTFNPGDEVLFYGEPYVGRYMTQNVYRLTWSASAGVPLGSREAAPSLAGTAAIAMMQRAHVEYDKVYYSTYTDLARNGDHFFDNPLYPTDGSPTAAVTYTFQIENLVPLGDAEVRVGVHGGLALADRNPDQSLLLWLNRVELGPAVWDGSITHVITKTVPSSALVQGSNKLALIASLDQLPELDKYWVSPDWAEIRYAARTTAKNDRLFIESLLDFAAGDIEASGFSRAGILAYDVSDPVHPVRLTGVHETNVADSYSLTFAGMEEASYYLTTPAALLAPATIEYDAPSSLASLDNTADYIAIVHRSLWDAVQPLLDHRTAEGLRVAKIDVQDVYDEFSGGRIDPEAIRSFLSYAYHSWNPDGPRPQYVLLVGDGHFDFKGSLRPDLPNLIPPYLIGVDPFIGETAADNRYVSVDGEDDFLPDMAIGRIPARSAAEVTAVIDKILVYETSGDTGDWQRRVVFVADNKSDPAGNFHALSEKAREAIPAAYDAQAIYYKSSPELDTVAEMKASIKSTVEGQALYVQWFGHAARTFWGKDKIWELNDPIKLAQGANWPFTASYSCWAGYFINVQANPHYGNNEQSLGEAMLLAPGRASLADFSPTGLHVGNDLLALNKGLIETLFVRRVARVGLAATAAKLEYFRRGGSALDLIDTQVLFGDPATQLRLPAVPLYLPLLVNSPGS